MINRLWLQEITSFLFLFALLISCTSSVKPFNSELCTDFKVQVVLYLMYNSI